MRIAVAALYLHFVSWRADWAWGLPLIVLTAVIHVSTLGLMNQRDVQVFSLTQSAAIRCLNLQLFGLDHNVRDYAARV
jgi:hypothetical protein